MGLPWAKKEEAGGDAAKKPAPAAPASTSGAPAASSSGKPPISIAQPQQEGPAPAGVAASSLFEFGPLVQVGSDIMRGVCVGEDPDAIQACTWHVEPAQGKPRDKAHTYRIEF
jgi:hypothetical protein